MYLRSAHRTCLFTIKPNRYTTFTKYMLQRKKSQLLIEILSYTLVPPPLLKWPLPPNATLLIGSLPPKATLLIRLLPPKDTLLIRPLPPKVTLLIGPLSPKATLFIGPLPPKATLLIGSDCRCL
jgi:hypothetical protein